ncbi:MAG: hypothetical protein AAF485_05335 [Chloroflexota bacterium]
MYKKNRKDVCIYFYDPLDNGDPVTFWLGNGRVIGIELWEPAHQLEIEDKVTIDNAQNLYGRPDLVGWSRIYGPNHRAVVWLEDGAMADVDRYGRLVNLLFFTPVAEEEFETLPWARNIEDEPNLDSSWVDLGPRDPFDWE